MKRVPAVRRFHTGSADRDIDPDQWLPRDGAAELTFPANWPCAAPEKPSLVGGDPR